MASDGPDPIATTPSSSRDVPAYLRDECGVCPRCASLVLADRSDVSPLTADHHRSSFPGDDGSDDEGDGLCTVCFGLSSPSYQHDWIVPIIRESILPYCRGLLRAEDGNCLTRESPTVNLPWLVAVRAHCAVSAARHFLKHEADPAARRGVRLRGAEELYSRVKEGVRSSLNEIISEELIVSDDDTDDEEEEEEEEGRVFLSEEMHEEEAGYLGVHVLVLPPSSDSSDGSSLDDHITKLIPPSFQAHIRKQKRQILQAHHRVLHPRKRFRGNDPTLKQGGDPRLNLELRVRSLGHHEKNWGAPNGYGKRGGGGDGNGHVEKKQKMDATTSKSSGSHEWNTIVSWLEKNTVLEWLEETSPRVGSTDGDVVLEELNAWLRNLHRSSKEAESSYPEPCSVHAATFRRPFHVRGTYTKSRRDVSQTPFYVPAPNEKSPIDDGEEYCGGRPIGSNYVMVRKGSASVEEEVCGPLASIGCRGISKRNNDKANEEDYQKGAVVYGLAKFHASGREDMDVRMLLPPRSVAEASAKSGVVITGRPFVCEIYDAHRMPSQKDLAKVVKAINFEEKTSKTNGNSDGATKTKEIETDERGWPTTLVPPGRYHGANPVGVGVSSPLSLVPSAAFSGLQTETEEKTKLYACVCHTSVPIASEEELVRKLGCSPWNEEGEEKGKKADGSNNNNGSGIYPLEIRQGTPLRVLHRRSSDVRTRRVLSLSAKRIDDHWFRLRMSTSAGTYVKEFVHGDCGRTRPNIGSMLGGRTDITELDCEGIAL